MNKKTLAGLALLLLASCAPMTAQPQINYDGRAALGQDFTATATRGILDA